MKMEEYEYINGNIVSMPKKRETKERKKQEKKEKKRRKSIIKG